MNWNDHSREMPDGIHAFLSPSSHSWCNYTDDKLTTTFVNKLAVARGTELHALACELIKMKVRLPNEEKTLNMYVNDCIKYDMEPEKKLYYSKYCFGTADAIGIKGNLLRIHDLKTGKTKASMLQLWIYAALFFLEYPDCNPGLMKVECRIYQSNDVKVSYPETDDIVPIMDKIIRFSKILGRLEEEFNGQ